MAPYSFKTEICLFTIRVAHSTIKAADSTKIKVEWNDLWDNLIIIFFFPIKSHSFHSSKKINFLLLNSMNFILFLFIKIKWNEVNEKRSIITVSLYVRTFKHKLYFMIEGLNGKALIFMKFDEIYVINWIKWDKNVSEIKEKSHISSIFWIKWDEIDEFFLFSIFISYNKGTFFFFDSFFISKRIHQKKNQYISPNFHFQSISRIKRNWWNEMFS